MILDKNIRIGFFKDFKGEDSILISADIHGLLELESAFLQLASNERKIKITDIKYLDKEHTIPMTLYSTDTNEGLRQIGDFYEWKLTSEKWDRIRQMTTTLYRNDSSGHQYLDSDSFDNLDLQVILSFNEYNDDFWTQVGQG